MAIEFVDPSAIRGWDSLLLQNPDYSFFQSAGWAAALTGAYGYKPIYLAMFDSDELSLVMPLMEIRSYFTGTRGVSLPFTDHCSPFAKKSDLLMEARGRVLAYGRSRRWRFVEWRGVTFPGDRMPAFRVHLTHNISLEKSEEELFSNLSESNRRSIRKALREGVSITVEKSMSSLKSFYRLNCLTCRRHGLPPQPFLFFKKIYENVISEGHGFVIQARHEGRPVAASLFFIFGTHAIFKYGASNHIHHGFRPNNALMWNSILWLKRNGIARLNLGRTEPWNEGLLRYKRTWGGDETTLSYHRYCFKKEAFITDPQRPNPRLDKIFRKTPLEVLRIVGRLAYRHFG